jgi:hypothetical protein
MAVRLIETNKTSPRIYLIGAMIMPFIFVVFSTGTAFKRKSAILFHALITAALIAIPVALL